mgnify:CR=1 FL=1
MKQLHELKGLGPKRLEALRDAGVLSLRDLLDCLPRDYLFAQQPRPVSGLKPGTACVRLRVLGAPRAQYYGGKSTVRAEGEDQSGRLRLYWFNQPWMARNLKKDQVLTFYGSVQEYQGRLGLVNPRIIQKAGIVPVYRPLPGLPGKVFASLVDQALESMTEGEADTLPEAFLAETGLADKLSAWRMAHRPKTEEDIRAAKRRLAFENLLLFQLAVRLAEQLDRGALDLILPAGNEGVGEELAQLRKNLGGWPELYQERTL